MFFEISKVIGFFLMPSNAIAAVIVIGVVLITLGRRRGGLRWLAVGISLLFIVGFSPLAKLLLLPLSERFPAWQAGGRDPDGIIVLGGAIDPDTSAARNTVELGSAAERVLEMLRLAQKYPNAKIVFTGGSGVLSGGALEAPIAEQLLQEFGVKRERIVIEQESRSTSENAVFAKRLIAPSAGQRWLLVTSAWHMPRSIAAFRASDFAVEAYPVDWRTRGWRDWAQPFNSVVGGLLTADLAAHEWLGLIAYRLTGRTAELLPKP